MPNQKDKVEVGAGAKVQLLLTRKIQPICNWHEWLDRWQVTNDFQLLESLLHVGFTIPLNRRWDEPDYNSIDRYIFYFSIADGWTDIFFHELPEDEGIEYSVWDSSGGVTKKTPSNLRQQVARKAFNMLCQNFFKAAELFDRSDRRGGFNYVWRQVVSERFFPVIQNFFRVEEGRFGDRIGIRNLTLREDEESHNEKQAINFLLVLAEYIWGWKETEISSWRPKEEQEVVKRENVEIRSRLEASKPWMVEVLFRFNRLDVLRKRMFEINKACLDKLREIAFRCKFSEHIHPVSNDRGAVTLDEACYLGSKASWFLKEHELVIREHKRLNAIVEAEQKKEEADRDIEKLSGKE